MATYRIELYESNNPRGSLHVQRVRQLREALDYLRHDRLSMQKAIGNGNPAEEASYAHLAAIFGVKGTDQAEMNAQAKRLYDELTGFFTALDAAGGDNIRGYLGLVG